MNHDSEPKFTAEHRLAFAVCVAAAFPLLDAICAIWPSFAGNLSPIAAMLFVMTVCVVILTRND